MRIRRKQIEIDIFASIKKLKSFYVQISKKRDVTYETPSDPNNYNYFQDTTTSHAARVRLPVDFMRS
jgi:hypothetical protein